MIKELEDILNIDSTKLVPSKICKSEIYFISREEFIKLYKHLHGSLYEIENYDTIDICNKIFKIR